MPTSLRIFGATVLTICLTIGVMRLQLISDNSPLWARIIMWFLCVGTFFGFAPAMAGVVIGIRELGSESTRLLSAIAVAGNSLLVAGYAFLIFSIWPALMGI